jgi:hypothetical protein
LRIHNQGVSPISSLSVIFPEDEIVFGDVPGGATTEYVPVPNGVYGYAGYRFELNGEVVIRPVIDWVGEAPIEGSAFTYTIQVDLSAPSLQTIQLVTVNRDS